MTSEMPFPSCASETCVASGDNDVVDTLIFTAVHCEGQKCEFAASADIEQRVPRVESEGNKEHIRILK